MLHKKDLQEVEFSCTQADRADPPVAVKDKVDCVMIP